MLTRAARHGSALLMTLIALLILTVLVLGAIEFTGRNQSAAVAKGRGERMEACAQTARRYLLSRLSAANLSVPIGELRLEQTLMDEVAASERSVMRTGHYGTTAAVPTAAQLPATAVSSSSRQVRDLANTAPTSTLLGASYYRVVMMCEEPGTGRASEVEFVFRYGL
jgi:hypothetical protein